MQVLLAISPSHAWDFARGRLASPNSKLTRYTRHGITRTRTGAWRALCLCKTRNTLELWCKLHYHGRKWRLGLSSYDIPPTKQEFQNQRP